MRLRRTHNGLQIGGFSEKGRKSLSCTMHQKAEVTNKYISALYGKEHALPVTEWALCEATICQARQEKSFWLCEWQTRDSQPGFAMESQEGLSKKPKYQ